MNPKIEQNSVDYDRIKKAIEFISANVSRQPSLDEIAAHLHLSPFHCQRLFKRWAGLTPKQFLQVLTLERAKELLALPTPLLETSNTLGLSGSSRLHDHFVTLEAVTPGEFKRLGKGINLSFGVIDTPFGSAFVATTERGICKLAFLENHNIESEIENLKSEWPLAYVTHEPERIAAQTQGLFDEKSVPNGKISLFVSGTNFQVNVWKSLLRIPAGSLVSYSDIASTIARPNAVRAVGTAIGANPVGFLIPCHRVLRQSGALGGYRWGLTRKQALLAWETGITNMESI